jgi:hypothetical protein
MNYLAIVQELHELAGCSGPSPATVSGATGETLRLVNWVRRAWDMIQARNQAWNWMQADFSFNTTAGVREYTPAAAGLSTRFKDWHCGTLRCYLTATGVADEQFLVDWDYDVLRDTYLYGSQSTNQSRPVVFAVRPEDKALILADIPDAVYTVRGRYAKNTQTLSADTDIPECPEHFHAAITYRALMMYGAYEAAGEVVQEGTTNYRQLMLRMADECLPAITLGQD